MHADTNKFASEAQARTTHAVGIQDMQRVIATTAFRAAHPLLLEAEGNQYEKEERMATFFHSTTHELLVRVALATLADVAVWSAQPIG